MSEMASGWVGSDAERNVDVEDARAVTSALMVHGTGMRPRAGWLPGPGTQGQVTASGTADTDVHVAAFRRVVANSRGTFGYVATLSAPKSLDVLIGDPADPSNERYDLVVAQQSDAFYGDTNSEFVVHRVTGVPAASPTDPPIPGSPDYVLLARVRVAAGAMVITSGMIDDLRPADRTAAAGGVVACTSTARPADAVAVDGALIFETDTGRFQVRSSGGWRQIYTAIGSELTTNLPLRTTTTSDASLSSTAHGFQIGTSTGLNLRMDANEIMAVTNGAASPLGIQTDGGLTTFGTGGLLSNGIVQVLPPVGAASIAQQWNHGYELYVDNIGAGSTNSRWWLASPNGSQFVIGPRSGSEYVADMRIRTNATTSDGANLNINSSTFQIRRSTSSLRYKQDVEGHVFDSGAVLGLRPVSFRDRSEVTEDPDTTTRYVGLIAEEVHDAGLSEFVTYLDGQPDAVRYDRIVLALLQVAQSQAEQITALSARIDAEDGA